MTTVVLDVSGLPSSVMNHRAPIWWGNVLMLAIESTMFLLLIASYFYIWQNYTQWPPPQTLRMPVEYNPLPRLGWSTILSILLLLSLAPMLWGSRACTGMNERQVRWAMILTVLMGIVIIAVEYRNISTSTHFKWSDNAYASIVWAILGLHLFHSVVATGENALMTIWVLVKGLDHKHARDIRIGAVYWYWLIVVWLIIYALLYWVPRIV